MSDRRPDPRSPAAEPPSVPGGASSRDLAAGARVRVTSGAFAGKSGVVAGADGKGGVLVVLGQITVRVLREEIELAPVAARDRPVLPTSHQRQPARKKAR